MYITTKIMNIFIKPKSWLLPTLPDLMLLGATTDLIHVTTDQCAFSRVLQIWDHAVCPLLSFFPLNKIILRFIHIVVSINR